MKLKWFGDDTPEPRVDPNEADALRGKYSQEDLTARKRQLANTELLGPSVETPVMPGPDGKPSGATQTTEPKEDWVDTERRYRTIVTNGQGALGQDMPHGRESAIADFQLGKMTRWATETLSPNNALRKFLEADEKDNFHLSVDRSIERDMPEVVLGYKPMFYPGGQPVQAPTVTDKDKKKP